jgi:hypothetical protein
MKIRHWPLVIGHGIVLAGSLFAQSAPGDLDTLFMKNGEKRVGKLAGIDAQVVRLQVPLPAAGNALSPALATVTIPRADIHHVEFVQDPARDHKLSAAGSAQLGEVALIWFKLQPWLGLPRSAASQAGLVYGDLLLRSGTPENAAKALDLFQKIEKETWNEDDKILARQGRLRAMVATGNAKGAVAEAVALEKISEDPAVLIEAKYILAEAAEKTLRKLIEDNPRWQEDFFVIPERNKLYNEALDLYLYPYLFFGSEAEPSARGLWGAIGMYRSAGDLKMALETARDLVAIYPGNRYTKQAAEFIASLPEDLRKEDHEKEAQQ